MNNYLLPITLQILGRDFDRLWKSVFANPEGNVFDILGDSAGIIGIIVVVIFSVIIIARTVKSQVSYVKPSGHLGVYAFQFRNKRFVGFVNENHEVTKTDALERLAKKMGNEFIMPIDELKQWINDGHFYAYDVNIIKKFKNQLEGGNKALVLSPVPIDDSAVSKEDEKGEWNIIGTSRELFRIHPKNLLLSEYSRIIPDEDYYGKKINVFIIAPYIDTTNKRLSYNEKQAKIVESPIIGKSAYINVVTFPPKYYDSLAKIASKITTFSELENDLSVLKDSLKDQKDINKLQAKEIVAKQAENQQLVNMTKIHAFVKGGITYIPVTPQSFAVIAIASAIAGFVSNAISKLPYFASLQGMEYLFLIATIVIILVLIRKKSNVPPPTSTDYPRSR